MRNLSKPIHLPKGTLWSLSTYLFLLAMVAALIFGNLLVFPHAIQAKADKVAICHVDGKGSYKLIHVAAKAVDAHMGHGDARPGDPGFDENCAQVPILSPGCQAANIPPTLVTGDQPLLIGPGAFDAGETISVTNPSSLNVTLKIEPSIHEDISRWGN